MSGSETLMNWKRRWRARLPTRRRRIDETLLPARVRHATLRVIPPDGVDLPRIVDEFERSIIETALRQTSGNQTKASQLLGLRVQTLNMKLKRFAELNRPLTNLPS